jgi:hypothetical protein
MIIFLDLSPVDLSNVDSEFLADRVTAVVRSHRRGHNLAICTRATATWMLQNLSLIGSDRSALQRISSDVTQNGDLIRRAARLLKVSRPGTPFGRINDKTIQIPLDYPFFESVVSQPILLVEDIGSDLPVYAFMLQNVSVGGTVLPVSFEPAHGGGESITQVAELKAREHRVIYAVADSDRMWPEAASFKEASLHKAQTRTNWPLLFYSVTPCHEIENAFDLNVLYHLPAVRGVASYSSLIKIHDAECALEVVEAERYRLFFDMKHGISAERLSSIADERVRSWIIKKLALPDSCPSEAVLPGFGPNLLSEVLKSGECLDEFRKTIRSRSWQQVFLPIISDMAWTFVAPRQQRT